MENGVDSEDRWAHIEELAYQPKPNAILPFEGCRHDGV